MCLPSLLYFLSFLQYANQVNEETGNRRPVMLSLPPSEKKDTCGGGGGVSNASGGASNAGTPTGIEGGSADVALPLGSVGGILVEGKSKFPFP